MRIRIVLLSIIFFPVVAMAQKVEFGLNGGVSTCSQPSDNMYYKGDKMAINYAAALKMLMNLGDKWQVGVEASSLELSRRSDKVYPGIYGNDIGGDDKKFVYAKYATSVSAIGNVKLNVYNGYLYGGLAAGYSIMRNNSQRMYANESYKAPDGGNGPVIGGQIGYTHGLSPSLGFNIQAGFRHYILSYDAEAPIIQPYQDINYRISAYSLTVGLRYRIITWKVQNNIPAFRGKGRSR